MLQKKVNIYYVIHIHLVHNFQNVQDLLHFQEKRFDISRSWISLPAADQPWRPVLCNSRTRGDDNPDSKCKERNPNAKTCREIGNGFKNLQITHLWRHIYWNLWTKIRNGNYKHTFAHDFCENMSKMLIGCSLQCCHTPGVVDTDRATDMNYLWRRRGRTITSIKKVVKNGQRWAAWRSAEPTPAPPTPPPVPTP